MYKIDVLPTLVIGRQDDSMVDEVIIDCSAWADNNPALTNYRVEMSIGGVKFAPLRQSYAEGVLKWEISQQDTAVAGEGRYEIVATGAGGHHKTSASATVYVNRRIPGRALAVPPDYVQPLLDRIAEMLAGAGGGSVTPEQIQQAVDNYLAENPAADETARQGVAKNAEAISQLSEEFNDFKESGGAGVAIDATLTQEGQAADSKAAGDAIQKLQDVSGSTSGINISIADNDTATIKSLRVTAVNKPQNNGAPGNIIAIGIPSGIAVNGGNDEASVLNGSRFCATVPPAKLETYANYTAEDGAKYIADVRDWSNGIDYRHLARLAFTGSTAGWVLFYDKPGVFVYSLNSVRPCAGADNNVQYVVQCSHYKAVTRGELYSNLSTIHDTHNFCCGARDKQFVVADSRFQTVKDFCAYLKEQYEAGTPVEMLYVPASVVEEQIPDREQTAYSQFVLPVGATVRGQHSENYVELEYWKDFIGKAYVDEKTKTIGAQEKKYVTPEDYGAYGDMSQDDSAAISACINAAVAQGLPIKMYGKYKVSQPIEFGAHSGLNVEINSVLYTGTDAAIRLAGCNNIISVGRIESYGRGIYVYTNGTNVYCNSFTIGEIVAENNCIEQFANARGIWQNRFAFSALRAGANSMCIYSHKEGTGSFCTENTYRGGQCASGLWGVHMQEGNSKIENVQFEGVMNGIHIYNGSCNNIYGCRYAELLYQQHGTLLKLSGEMFGNRFAGNAMIYYECIDVSEMSTGQVSTVDSQNLGSVLSKIDGVIAVQSGESVTSRAVVGAGAYVQQNGLVLIPMDKDIATITQTPYAPITTDCRVPDIFKIAAENCVINLDRSYISFGHNDIIIDQREEGKTAMVYDYRGTLIFDGGAVGNGVYRLLCVKTDREKPVNNSNNVWEVYKQA